MRAGRRLVRRLPDSARPAAVDDLSYSSGFGKLAVAWNFITLALFLFSQCVFYYRERWLENSFAEDKRLSVENLAEEIKLYPAFKRKLETYNSVSVWLSSSLMAFLVVNLVLSSINILRFHYAGKASIIGLLSNTGLVAFKARAAGRPCAAPPPHATAQVINWFVTARTSNAQDVRLSRRACRHASARLTTNLPAHCLRRLPSPSSTCETTS